MAGVGTDDVVAGAVVDVATDVGAVEPSVTATVVGTSVDTIEGPGPCPADRVDPADRDAAPEPHAPTTSTSATTHHSTPGDGRVPTCPPTTGHRTGGPPRRMVGIPARKS